MANTCTTEYVIVGEKEFISKLYDTIGCDDYKWCGDVLVELGLITAEELNKDNAYDLRGEWMSSHILPIRDIAVLYLNENSKWTRSDGYSLMCEKINSQIDSSDENPIYEMYYYSEEPGCGIYETNDEEGEYFPERWQAWYTDDSLWDSKRFEKQSDAIDWINKNLGTEYSDIQTLQENDNCGINEIEITQI